MSMMAGRATAWGLAFWAVLAVVPSAAPAATMDLAAPNERPLMPGLGLWSDVPQRLRGGYPGGLAVVRHLSRQWSVYGETALTGPGPARARRTDPLAWGYLGGLGYTPTATAGGASYRLEAGSLPDPRGYADLGDTLGWYVGGRRLGHRFGGDGAGLRLEARHPLSHGFDLCSSLELYSQQRHLPVALHSTELRLGLAWDLAAGPSFGLGWRHFEQSGIGGVTNSSSGYGELYFLTSTGF
jgi:hypothetical protein